MNPAQNMNSQNLSTIFREDLMAMSTGRRSRRQSIALASHYQSKGSSIERIDREGMGLMGNLLRAAEASIADDFQKIFTFGIQMKIWRKGRSKNCCFFLDQNLSSFLWVSSQTKAFLFDLTFTTIRRFDFQLQKESKLKHYFILRYFEEELPVIFQGEKASTQAHSYFQLFNSYIIYCRIMNVHPSYFSKILKNSIIEDIKDDIVRSKQAKDILKVANQISWNSITYNQTVMNTILAQKGAHSNLQAVLTPEEINDFFKITSCCEGIREVFERFAGVRLSNYKEYLRPIMSKQAFLDFLTTEQGEPREVIEQIHKQYAEFISFYEFSLYLLNEKNNYAALPDTIDENLPLTDYFCYSSHNTYLSGNQLTSDSKIERYLQDLDDGIKCVEIDVHNDGDRPIITHAFKDKGFCKPIDFEETINAIAGFCHENQNHYPIILSIENHASETNKFKMFDVLTKAFGKKLLLVSTEIDLHEMQICKTLAQLKGKIIVKTSSKLSQVKPFKKEKHLQQVHNRISREVQLSNLMPKGKFSVPDFSQKHFQFEEFIKRGQARKQRFLFQLQKEIYLPLQEMTKITGMFKTHDGVDSTQSTGYECVSLTNEKAMKTPENILISYTKRSWLRIYPVGTEITSSNYNPVPLLRIGAQIIALNTQTKDDYARMMMSYFTAGREFIPAKIGYVPKPYHLRSNVNQPRERLLKMIEVKIFSNEKVSLRLFGSEQDMNNNANATSNFNVRDYLQGFLMFTIAEEYRDSVPLRFLRRGFRVLVGKNAAFRDSGKRVLFYTSVKTSSSS